MTSPQITTAAVADRIERARPMAEDIIEQAARVMHEEVCCPLDPDGCDEPTERQRTYARALYDAGRLRREVTDEMVLVGLNAEEPRAATTDLSDWTDESQARMRRILEAALGVR